MNERCARPSARPRRATAATRRPASRVIVSRRGVSLTAATAISPACRRSGSPVGLPARSVRLRGRVLPPDRLRLRRVAYQERPVLTQEVDCAAAAEVDVSVELLEILEVDDCSDSHPRIAPGRPRGDAKARTLAVFRTCHERFAHEESRRAMVPLSNEVRAVRDVEMRWRGPAERWRWMPCASTIVSKRTCRTPAVRFGQNFVQSLHGAICRPSF